MAAQKFKSKEARKLYSDTVAAFELDEHDHQTLCLACDSLDRISTAKMVLSELGDFIKDRYGGIKANPASRELQQNKVIYARLIRELKLEEGAAQDIRVPRLVRRQG